MAIDARPAEQDQAIIRSEDVIRLIDQELLNDVKTAITTRGLETGPWRHFTLYLRIKSAGTPTTVQFIVEFLEPVSGKWHIYKQDLFASFFWEDQDTATEQDECFSGDCAGRDMRLRVLGVGTTASATFTISAAVEFWN